MDTLTTSYAEPAPRATARRLLRPRLVRFLIAYLEMTVSMVVGMQLLGVVWDAVRPGLTSRPDAMALTMAVDMTLGMSAWMWVRGHPTRHIAQMSAVMVVPFPVLLVPYWLGAISGEALLTWGHVAMFALMAAFMARVPHAGQARQAPHGEQVAHLAGPPSTAPQGATPASRTGRTAAGLLVLGATLAVLGGLLHPHSEPPNSHLAVFAEYARSTDWVWVHDLQFLSGASVVAGFLVLGRALRRAGVAPALVRLGDTTAAATVALIAMNMAVDGVALKRAVDAWASAGAGERAERFAVAEGVRWVEWGVNSFFTIALGLTVLICAVALLQVARRTRLRLAAVSGALAGGMLVVNGLAVGAHGFEPSALPFVATALYVVMALCVPALDRPALASTPEARAYARTVASR